MRRFAGVRDQFQCQRAKWIFHPTLKLLWCLDVEFEPYVKERMWPILVETVHSLVMFPNHKAYTRDVILIERPDITPADLAARLKISLGEALVILFELHGEKRVAPTSLPA